MPTRILVIDDSPTIRKVVRAILERRGYETVDAADGQLGLDALSDEARFDVVLLDFVMPKMNGYQFCRAVRSEERFRNLPVILMSAKSDKIREQFVLQTGAVDAITKPFDSQALVAVIENVLQRVAQGKVRPNGFDLEEAPSSSHKLEEALAPARAAVEFGTRLARSIAPVLAKLPESAVGDEALIAGALVSKLGVDTLREIARSSRDFASGPLVLYGDLAALPIGAILQMLQVERQSGILEIVRPALDRTEASVVRAWQSVARDTGSRAHSEMAGSSEVTITWRNGLVDLVQSHGAGDEFRLGRFFVEEGLVSPEEIESMLRRRDSKPPLDPGQNADKPVLGDMLLEAERVTEEELKVALVRQASELIYEVLRWQKGRFEFLHANPSPLAERAKLSLPVASVVMEGFRRVDEWRGVESTLGSFESVLKRDPMAIEALGLERLSRSERAVLDTIDGERTIRETIGACFLSSFDTCRILSQFLEARVVRRVDEV
jgi:CheY-like chemotaxis protein